MMMKFFSFKLYRQSLRRARLAGFIFAVVTVFLNLFPFLSARLGSYGEYTVEAIPVESVVPFAALLLLGGPVLMLLLFRFLTRREESDFYHSLPVTRPCLFFSLTAAALTYIWGTLLVTFSLNSVLYLTSPMGKGFPLTDTLLLFVGFLVGTLLMIGIAGIAVSVTGTTLSAFLVGTLLTFLFRVLCLLFLGILNDIVPALFVSGGLFSFFDPSFFLPIRLAGSVLDASFVSGVASRAADYGICLLYNLLLCAVALPVGCLLFACRPSEDATRPTTNGKLQFLCRCGASLPFAFLSLWLLISYLFSAVGNDVETGSIVIFGLLAVLVYFLYELITVKKFGALKKAALQFPLVLLICGVATGACLLIRSSVLSFRPAAEEIASVQYLNIDDYLAYLSYEDAVLGTVETDNGELIRISADALKNTLRADEAHRGSYGRATVRYRLKNGRVITRNVTIVADTAFYTLLQNDPACREKLLSLPSWESLDDVSSYYYGVLPEAPAKRLYQCFSDEYNALSEQEKIAYKRLCREGGGAFANIELSGTFEGQYFENTYPLTDFPKTQTLLFQILSEQNGNQTVGKLKDILAENFGNAGASGGSDAYADIECALFYPDCPIGTYYFTSENFTEEGDLVNDLTGINNVLDLLLSDPSCGKPLSASEPFIRVLLNLTVNTYHLEQQQYVCYTPATKETLDAIAEIGMYGMGVDVTYVDEIVLE